MPAHRPSPSNAASVQASGSGQLIAENAVLGLEVLDLPGQLTIAGCCQHQEDGVLAAYHRRRAYPFIRNDDTRAKFGARQSIPVRTCNLLPEIMEIPVPTRGQQTQWQPVQAIDVQPYAGVVHSLGVAQHEHYIADGLVTHNCFYGWREGAAQPFFGPTNATDLWSIKKVNPQSMIPLTEKPVQRAARAMKYSSKPGENVLDLFGGNGSTLIAVEQTGRKAFLMELDPLYCDVIVQRFEQFTGQKAERCSGV